MRLGIFGGSFDPVHYGHLLLAECCREQCRLDQVWFLPTAVSPFKAHGPRVADAERLEMLGLAIGGHPALGVCRLEIDRGGTCYTVDTLAELKAQDPASELFFLMGSDSLALFPDWREPARICDLATLVVVERPEMPGIYTSPTRKRGEPEASVHPGFPSLARRASENMPGSEPSAAFDRARLTAVLGAAQVERIESHRVRMPSIGISSRDLRERVSQGHSIRYQTPRAVEMYIASHGLYLPG